MNLNYPLIIDGGFATVLEGLGCDLNHKLWSAKIIDEDPGSIIEVHRRYIAAGAQIIATASYQASIPGLMEHGYSREKAIATILKTVTLAQKAIEQSLKENPGLTPAMIGASIGPYGAYLADGSEYRGNYGVSEQQLYDFHFERIKVLHDSEADLLLFETFPDINELKVVAEITGKLKKPSWVSFACKDGAHLNDGTPIEQAAALFNKHPSVFAIGVNCTRPIYISDLIERLKSNSDRKLVVYPNSNEHYDAESKSWSGENQSQEFAQMAQQWLKDGADIVGGCCRIGPGHIKLLRDTLVSKD